MHYLEAIRWGPALKIYMRTMIWGLLLEMLSVYGRKGSGEEFRGLPRIGTGVGSLLEHSSSYFLSRESCRNFVGDALTLRDGNG